MTSGAWGIPVADGGLLVFDDASHAVACTAACEGSDVPTEVKEMSAAFPEVAAELWSTGVAATSAIRATAFVTEPRPDASYVEWPLARPIADFVRPDQSGGLGQSVLEDNVDAVRALKDLRASFLRGEHGYFNYVMLITSNGENYEMYLRDTLPFEDANGIVPLSAAAAGF